MSSSQSICQDLVLRDRMERERERESERAREREGVGRGLISIFSFQQKKNHTCSLPFSFTSSFARARALSRCFPLRILFGHLACDLVSTLPENLELEKRRARVAPVEWPRPLINRKRRNLFFVVGDASKERENRARPEAVQGSASRIERSNRVRDSSVE